MDSKEIQIVESFRLLSKNIVNFFDNNLLKKTNISCSELSVLKLLGEREKENQKMNVTELSNSLGITKSAASQLVSKLEKKGYVRRRINLFDKKVNYISVTEDAKEGYKENYSKYNQVVKRVVAEMGESDCNELSVLLQKLSNIIYNLGEVE